MHHCADNDLPLRHKTMMMKDDDLIDKDGHIPSGRRKWMKNKSKRYWGIL
ncbi:MAG TPA: hypothetical protein VIJ95_10705 [Hanamia sp.]